LHIMAVTDPIQTGGETVRKVELLVKLAPEMAGGRGRARAGLPLHAAVDHESMLTYGEKTDELLVSVVRLLIESHPEALQQPDSSGNLALHAGTKRYAPMPILRLLIEHCPEALQVRNPQGLLPVHRALHRARSEALQGEFGFCCFPSGCDLTLEVDSVLLLVEQWPGSIQELDSRGRTLVHCALDGPETPGHRVDLSLLQKWLDAVLVRDHQGFEPLHVATIADGPLDLLYSILQLQQKRVREQAERRQEYPKTTIAKAAGPHSSKRSRTGSSHG
jgi:hypothetical protein